MIKTREKQIKMNYTEAVKLARAGKQQGFEFLFESTYKSKYYLALQYMRDEEAAKDVLQEAYMRAFSKLEALQNPEAFPGWLGIIVANTARNMLAKKSPQLFSAVDSEEGTDRPEFQIADERIDSQPELAYTRQETQELVHELIDSLSAEQRMCILMFYIEGASIKEIAAAAGCSENTVKSRLNYGRKNLKSKAEVLQRKGYRLYGAAPLPLLLLLLRAECRAMDADGAFAAVGRAVRETIFSAAHVGNLSHMSALAGKTAKKTAAKKGLKGGFIHTAAGKAAAIAVGACVTGAAVFGGASWISSHSDSTAGSEADYVLSAQIDQKYTEGSGTSMRVTGTLTNQTDADWDEVDLIFTLVDSDQEPVEIGGIVPELRADITSLPAGETQESVTSWFPRVLESDFEKVADYHVEKLEYGSAGE